MYYFYYFVRIFREIFGRRALKKIVIIGGVIAVVFLLQKNKVFGYTGLEGNDSYTDPNNSIYQIYDGYLNDLAVRINNSSDSDVEDLIDRLTGTKQYSFICYYGTSNEDYNNDFKHLRVVLFNSNVQFADSNGNQWHNMDCQFVYNNTNSGLIYDFSDLDCTRTSLNITVYFPYMLINRYNQTLVEVLSNKTNTSSSDIIGALNTQTTKIQEQTTAINNQTTKIEEQTDAMTSTDYTESDVDIDTSAVDSLSDTDYKGLFTTIFNSFNNAISSDRVEFIRVPIPHSPDNILVPSNVVSRYIPSALLTLIEGFWFYLFGFYAFKFINNLLVKIKDGSILDGYQSTEVISSDMM